MSISKTLARFALATALGTITTLPAGAAPTPTRSAVPSIGMAGGPAQLDTSAKFGAAALLLNGASLLTVGTGGLSAALGTGWTADFWVKLPPALPSQLKVIFGSSDGGAYVAETPSGGLQAVWGPVAQASGVVAALSGIFDVNGRPVVATNPDVRQVVAQGAASSYNDGAWHYVVLTTAPNTMQAAVDGTAMQIAHLYSPGAAGGDYLSVPGSSSSGVTWAAPNHLYSFAVGGSYLSGSNYDVSASIDELALWPYTTFAAVRPAGSVPAAPYSGKEGMAYLNHFDDAKLTGSGPVIVECYSNSTAVLALGDTCYP